MAIKKGNTTVWVVQDEYGDRMSAWTTQGAAVAEAARLGYPNKDAVFSTTGTVVNSKVTYYDDNA